MTMKDVHTSECPQCKIRDQFYEDFNSDSKKNISYFGVISYVNHYLFLPITSNQSKKEFSKNSYQNICFLQLWNEWTTRDLIAKSINKKTFTEEHGLIKHFKTKKSRLKTPSFYLPDHAGNLITIKKSKSFTESSPDDTIFSANLKPTKNVYKRKRTKKFPSKEKVARKEPKISTLKEKRKNLQKLKENGLYEDDLFEEKKIKSALPGAPEDSSNSDEKISYEITVHAPPRMQSRSSSYEDCINPVELQSCRKDAEQYQYRRNKRRNVEANKKGNGSTSNMKQDSETYKIIMQTSHKLKKLEKEGCESDQDSYFSDSEDSNT